MSLIDWLILAARAVVIAHGRPLPPPALWGTAPGDDGRRREGVRTMDLEEIHRGMELLKRRPVSFRPRQHWQRTWLGARDEDQAAPRAPDPAHDHAAPEVTSGGTA